MNIATSTDGEHNQKPNEGSLIERMKSASWTRPYQGDMVEDLHEAARLVTALEAESANLREHIDALNGNHEE